MLGRITDGFGRLVSEHLALARVELHEDARALAVDLVRIAVFVPLILVGYGLLNAALAWLLSPWLTIPGAFAAVGALNVAIGGFGAYRAADRLKGRQVLEGSREEVGRTTQTLSTVTRASGNGVERRLGA